MSADQVDSTQNNATICSEETLSALLHYSEIATNSAQQAENQRATMTNFIVSIAALLFAFVSQVGQSASSVVISIFVIVLGLFGTFMAIKYSQHFHLNYTVSRLVRKRVSELLPQAQLESIFDEAQINNRKKFPLMSERVPIVYLWQALYIAVIISGILSLISSWRTP